MRAIRKFSLTLAATATLLLLAIALTSVGANLRSAQSSAAKPTAKSAVAQTMKTYTMYSGLWRTDGSFVSTIRVKNVLVVAPMDVTPVLFMADGTPYPLPSVHLAVSGVATININDALANAPQSIAAHISQFGSAALIHTYSTPGHVSASMAVIDVPRSLSYMFPFSEPMGDAMPQTLEGLWWKHDPSVSGWIALSNVSNAATQATVQLVERGNGSQAERAITLAAHTTQMFHLEDFASNPSPLTKQAGGIRVSYTGQRGSVLVTGGLENDAEGYSANIPFWGRDMSSAPATSTTYASAGIMVGKPDPMMMPGFPKETTFSPYLVLRNTTEKPLDVSLQLNYMMGMSGSTMMSKNAPVTRNLPTQHLAPGEAKQVHMQSALNSVLNCHSGRSEESASCFNGSINLSVSFTGKGGDLVVASGSVDQTGTYVFEVDPQSVASSQSKFTNYWGIANGNDTMFSLWNPTETAQDILATFYYGDGSGKYVLPVHIEPQASTMIDMAMLVMEKKPDAAGNVVPPNIQEGSAQFTSAKGAHEQMTVVIAAGIYNISTATCGSGCITCCGDTNFAISPNPIFCPIGDTMLCTSTAVDCYGNTVDVATSSWISSNTAVMTVDASGNVHGVAVGSAIITAYDSFAPVYTGTICGGPTSCPTSSPQAGATGNVAPKIRLGGSNGTDITNATNQPAVVGQQIILYGDYTLPSGYTFTSLSWTIPGTGSTPPTAISNYTYTIGSNSTTGGPTSLTSDQLSQQTVTYYFVASASSQVVKFTLNYNDSSGTAQTAPAQATFNIAGPTASGPNGVFATTTLGQVAINPGSPYPLLQFGGTANNIGITFTAQANQPPGYPSWVFKWVNLISDDNITMTDSNGTQTTNYGTGFDTNGSYPSFQNTTPTTANDNPRLPLFPPCIEEKRTFDAQAYLMWNAGLTNPASIDVPLGSLTWGFSGDAVLQSGSWVLNGTPTKYSVGFTNSSSYPAWSSGHFNGPAPPCP